MPDGEYFPVDNIHPDPKNYFEVRESTVRMYMPECVAFVHSHPDQLKLMISSGDMTSQLMFNKTFGVANVTEGYCRDLVYWGPDVPIPPLEGREFRHGPSGSDMKGDCFSLIKDFYELEEHVILPEFPRDWEWWLEKDLYRDGFPKARFRRIEANEVERGDVFLSQIRSPVPNHGGIYMGDGVVLQHYVDRLSCKTALGPWIKYVTHWLRYEGSIPSR